ncbi:MAG: TRAP transporter small permease subunit [Alphaproteobacteria bacterium]
MPKLERAAAALDAALRGAAALLLGAVTALVAANAVGRYLFGAPGRLIEELSGLLMIALLFTALAVPGREGHIRVGLLADRAKGAAKKAFAAAALAILLLFAGIFAWHAFEQGTFNLRRNIRTELGGIPIWPWTMLMAAALAILALRSVAAFVRGARPRPAGPPARGN